MLGIYDVETNVRCDLFRVILKRCLLSYSYISVLNIYYRTIV
jgi:hypothetical protein